MSKNGKSKAVRKKVDKKIWMIAGAVVLVAVIVVGIFAALPSGGKTVLTVNGAAVKEDEFIFYLGQNRAKILNQYTAGQGLTYDEAFWDTVLEDGTTPLDAWIDAAVEMAVYNNAMWQAAKKAGVTKMDSYSDWAEDLARENKRRSEAVKNGEVIYGPENYTLNAYIQLKLSNLQEDMKKQYEKDFVATEDEMRVYYEENKEDFKASDTRLIQQISIAYGGESGLDAETAREKAEAIRQALLNGESIQTVMVQYADCAELTDKEYNNGRAEWGDAKLTPLTYSAAIKLSAGQISQITDEQSTLYISICTELFPGQYQAFEESTTFIQQKLLERSFEEYLDEIVDSAETERLEELMREAANSVKN